MMPAGSDHGQTSEKCPFYHGFPGNDRFAAVQLSLAALFRFAQPKRFSPASTLLAGQIAGICGGGL
jgi:hypothetical protein